MKINKNILKKIIAEELEKVYEQEDTFAGGNTVFQGEPKDTFAGPTAFPEEEAKQELAKFQKVKQILAKLNKELGI